jgi:hypothetical protein
MKTILFVLVAFVAVTAVLSGLIMIIHPEGDALNVPVSLLESAPFNNYVVPGLLLTITVGGPNLLALFFMMQRKADRYNWAMAGGFMISLWILTQFLFIRVAHGLQFVYLGTGLLIILIAYQLKGKWAV